MRVFLSFRFDLSVSPGLICAVGLWSVPLNVNVLIIHEHAEQTKKIQQNITLYILLTLQCCLVRGDVSKIVKHLL